MINNEYSVPQKSDDGNKKLVFKRFKVFLNREIDNKEHFVTSNNEEGTEDKCNDSRQSAGILGE